MTAMECTYDNIKSNILKIIINGKNEVLSQIDIYNRLLEIYNIKNKKTDTISENSLIKILYSALFHFINHKDVSFSINSGICINLILPNKKAATAISLDAFK